MNLVLHREQVALNVNAFDITADVTSQLNKLLTSVPVPPSVVTPGCRLPRPTRTGRTPARTAAREPGAAEPDRVRQAAKPGDPRFFRRAGPYSLARIAAVAGAETSAPERMISGVAPLQTAGPDDVSFLDNRRYAKLLAETKAGAVILHPDFVSGLPDGASALATVEPYVGWARVAALFHPPVAARPGVHPAAIVDATAVVDEGAEIGPGVVVGAGAKIGTGCVGRTAGGDRRRGGAGEETAGFMRR